MYRYYFFLMSCLTAALAPLFPLPGISTSPSQFPGWPTKFEGKILRQLPLTDREKNFAEEFPGRIGRFTDGNREIILRWLNRKTRKLHPSTDCFRGLGYSIQPLPLITDSQGNLWGAIKVVRSNQQYLIKERIFDEQNNSWTDVSAWYWGVLWNKTNGPWWSIVVSEKITNFRTSF